MYPLDPQAYSVEHVRHGVNYCSRKPSPYLDALTAAITPNQLPDIDAYDRDNIADLIEQIINAPPQTDQQQLDSLASSLATCDEGSKALLESMYQAKLDDLTIQHLDHYFLLHKYVRAHFHKRVLQYQKYLRDHLKTGQMPRQMKPKPGIDMSTYLAHLHRHYSLTMPITNHAFYAAVRKHFGLR